MGDLSEYRGLLTVVSFLGMFALLISLIPSGFNAAQDVRLVNAEQYEGFEAIDLQNFAETWNGSIDAGEMWGILHLQHIDIGGYQFDLVSLNANPPNDVIQMYHYDYWWIFVVGSHKMTWYDKRGFDLGTTVNKAELDSNYEVGKPLEFKAQCPHFFVKVFMNFNTTIYDLPSEAWDDNDLHVLIGINFDQTQTVFNAWDIIGMILFFSLPDINPIINAMIAIPLWACIAYVSFILILRAIGAIWGGGGA